MLDQHNSPIYGDLKLPIIFAHRGASAYAPENTLAAFNLAVEQGADVIELDAKLSSDGQVVVIHDDTVNRTTDGSGSVKYLTSAELRDLDAGSKFPPFFKPEKIPALEEVFESFGRKVFINVELKNYSSPNDNLAEKVTALVKKYNLMKTVLLSSFNLIALIQSRKILDDVALGLLIFGGLGEAVLRSKLVRFGPLLALHSSYLDVTPYLIQTVHKARSRVHVYNVNQAEQIQRLFKAGVDGIFTDDPLLARKILAESQP